MKPLPTFAQFLNQLRNFKGEQVRIKTLQSFGQFTAGLCKAIQPPKGKR